MAIAQNHVINIQPGVSAPLVIHCSQGDTGTQINLTVVNGDKEFDCSSYVCSVHGTRSDRANWGPFTCNVSGSTVSFSLTSDITAVAGSCLAEVSIGTVGTANFAFLVENATFEGGVTYSNDVSVYQNILNAVQDILNAVPAEKNERIHADNSLSSRISQNDTELRGLISAETQQRRDGDIELNSAVAKVNNRVNQLVSPTGEAPNPSEITDARVGVDGSVYSNLGTAIRSQVNNLNNDFSNAITHNYSVNLIENVNPTLGYTYSANATADNNYSADAGGAIYPVINIINGKTYSYVSIRASFSSVLYNSGTRLTFDNDDGKFTATDNGKLFLSVRKNDVGKVKFYDGDASKQGYFINELKIYESDIIKNNIIHVGSTRDIKGFIEAINKSKDGDIIIFDAEDYDIAEELGENWLNNYTYESKGYGFYIGGGKKFIFPYGATVKFHYTGNNAQVHEFFSPINAGQGDFELIGLHLLAKNCRYCVHDERATNDIFYRHTFKNCHFEMDNSENPNWNSKQCIGGGLGVNGIINVEDCIFNSVGGTYDLSYHNSKSNLAKSFISVTNSWFENSCRFSWYGDSQKITSILFNGNSVKVPITVSAEGTGSGSPYVNISVKQWNNEIRS